MLSSLKLSSREAVNRDTLYQNAMLAFCILFGIAMIADTQIAGDGSWFWYATLFRSGKRLYGDMHLALQPLFVLETAWFMAIFGKGWLVSKIPAVLHLIAYCVGLLLVVRRSDLPDGQKAIIFGSAFFVSLCSVAYRFDDYHVVAESLEIYSLVLLLMLQRSRLAKRCFYLSAGLGILSGLTFTTRVNDGAALFVGVGIAILCLAPSRRFLWFLLFSVATAMTVLVVVRLTGDTFHEYATTSIFKAAGGKGGTANVLAYPLRLLKNTLSLLHMTVVYYFLGIATVWVFLIRPFVQSRQRSDLGRLALGIVLILLPLYRYYHRLLMPDLIMGASAIGVYVLYGLGIFVFLRFLRWEFAPLHASKWNRLEILLIIPLGQLAAMSMSTGGFHYGVYGPQAMLILLLPIAYPFRLKSDAVKSILVAYAALLLCYGAACKFNEPYSWHSYHAQRMFTGRQWYRHPVYGPMIIESELLQFIEPVCKEINSDPGPKELLGLPNPFGNYFCAIPPWHDNVQTYYDTSTKETVDRIMNELQNEPPTWILYQKEPRSLEIHEKVFNQGRPLPHRFLAASIERKVREGAWHEAYTSDFGSKYEWDTSWTLIRTKP